METIFLFGGTCGIGLLLYTLYRCSYSWGRQDEANERNELTDSLATKILHDKMSRIRVGVRIGQRLVFFETMQELTAHPMVTHKTVKEDNKPVHEHYICLDPVVVNLDTERLNWLSIPENIQTFCHAYNGLNIEDIREYIDRQITTEKEESDL
jgi:hypothetical protein